MSERGKKKRLYVYHRNLCESKRCIINFMCTNKEKGMKSAHHAAPEAAAAQAMSIVLVINKIVFRGILPTLLEKKN